MKLRSKLLCVLALSTIVVSTGCNIPFLNQEQAEQQVPVETPTPTPVPVEGITTENNGLKEAKDLGSFPESGEYSIKGEVKYLDSTNKLIYIVINDETLLEVSVDTLDDLLTAKEVTCKVNITGESEDKYNYKILKTEVKEPVVIVSDKTDEVAETEIKSGTIEGVSVEDDGTLNFKLMVRENEDTKVIDEQVSLVKPLEEFKLCCRDIALTKELLNMAVGTEVKVRYTEVKGPTPASEFAIELKPQGSPEVSPSTSPEPTATPEASQDTDLKIQPNSGDEVKKYEVTEILSNVPFVKQYPSFTEEDLQKYFLKTTDDANRVLKDMTIIVSNLKPSQVETNVNGGINVISGKELPIVSSYLNTSMSTSQGEYKIKGTVNGLVNNLVKDSAGSYINCIEIYNAELIN